MFGKCQTSWYGQKEIIIYFCLNFSKKEIWILIPIVYHSGPYWRQQQQWLESSGNSHILSTIYLWYILVQSIYKNKSYLYLWFLIKVMNNNNEYDWQYIRFMSSLMIFKNKSSKIETWCHFTILYSLFLF